MNKKNNISFAGNVVEIRMSIFESVEKRLDVMLHEHYADLKEKINSFVKLARATAGDFTNSSNVNRFVEYPDRNDSRFHDNSGNFLQWIYANAKDSAYKAAYNAVNEQKQEYLHELGEVSAIGNNQVKKAMVSVEEFAASISKIRNAISNLEAVKCDFKEKVDAFKGSLKDAQAQGTTAVEEKVDYKENVAVDEAKKTYVGYNEKTTNAVKDRLGDNEELLALTGATSSKEGSSMNEALASILGKDSGGVRQDFEKSSIRGIIEGGDFKEISSAIPTPENKEGILEAVDTGEVKGTSFQPSSMTNDALSSTVMNNMSTKPIDKVVDIEPVSVPKQITQNNANYIDEQAKEIYYNRSPEQISAERANALSAVDSAFSGESDTQFREILSQCYDDIDIDIIMKNKELAVTAFILATESKSLTDIANKLAKSQGIDDYESSYEVKESRESLENGVSQSRLLSEVSEEVNNARTVVQGIRDRYNEYVRKTNESIEDANSKKAIMDQVRMGIIGKSGEDPSKWADEDIEMYNKAVEDYNSANRTANAIHKEALGVKAELDQAEMNLQQTQQRVSQGYLSSSAGEPIPNENEVGVQQQPVNNIVSVEPAPVVPESNPMVGEFVNDQNFVEAPTVISEKKLSSDDLVNLFNSMAADRKEETQDKKERNALELSTITPDERSSLDSELSAAIFGTGATSTTDDEEKTSEKEDINPDMSEEGRRVLS